MKNLSDLKQIGILKLLTYLCVFSINMSSSNLVRAEYCFVDPVEKAEWDVPENMLIAIQDNRGVIWFGTGSGLYKFDGHHYLEVENDDHIIVDMLLTHDNKLLMATWTSGAVLFDIESETFTELSEEPNTMYSVGSAGNNQYWMGGEYGIFKFDSDYQVVKRNRQIFPRNLKLINQQLFYSEWAENSKRGIYLQNQKENHFITKIRNPIIFTSEKQKLIWNRDATKTRAYSVKNGLWTTHFDEIGLYSLRDNNDGSVWMINNDNRLRHYDFINRMAKQEIDLSPQLGSADNQDRNYDILLKDSNETIWLYNQKKLLKINCTDAISIIKSSEMRNNSIMSVKQGEGNDLWFGGKKGLVHYVDQTQVEKIAPYMPEENDRKFSNYVIDMLIEDGNTIWVTTMSGLYRYYLNQSHWDEIAAIGERKQFNGQIHFWGEKLSFSITK